VIYYVLRDGSRSEDIKLDRLPSLNLMRLARFPFAASSAAVELEDVPLRTKMHRRGVLLDQTPREDLNYDGSGCVAFSTLAFMRSSPVRNPTIKVDLGNVPVDIPGAVYLYHEFQNRDEWPETRPGGEGGTSVDAGAKFMRELGVYGEYHWITNGSWELARVLQRQPAIMGTWWWSGMDQADRTPDGLALPTGRRRGGHAWEVDGVCVDYTHHGVHYDLLFRGQQTWGRWGWNKSGTFWIPGPAMDTLLSDQGECLVPTEVMQS